MLRENVIQIGVHIYYFTVINVTKFHCPTMNGSWDILWNIWTCQKYHHIAISPSVTFEPMNVSSGCWNEKWRVSLPY
jgi:hypothetical protein